MGNKIIRFLLKITGLGFILFAASFVIYFFNLDMKMTSKLEPFVLKFYDRRERVQRI